MDFKSPGFYEVFSWLNSRDEKVYVRIMLERPDKSVHEEFRRICKYLEKHYKNVVLYGHAYDKKSWIPIYTFKGSLPCESLDRYASCNRSDVSKWKGLLKSKNWSGLLIDDLWPWIYAKIHNKKNIQKYKDQDVVLWLDFVK